MTDPECSDFVNTYQQIAFKCIRYCSQNSSLKKKSIELWGYNHKFYYLWLHKPSHASAHTCSWKKHSASVFDW